MEREGALGLDGDAARSRPRMRKNSTGGGAAAAARAATLSSLVDEGARSEGHAALLATELGNAEREIAWQCFGVACVIG